MTKKINIIILIIIVIIINLLFCQGSKIQYGENYFLNCKAFFNAQEDTTGKIELTYFIDKNKIDIFETQKINAIEFENSDSIKINDYSVIYDEVSAKYIIKKLCLLVDFKKIGTEKINNLIITDSNGENYIFDIGEWNFYVGKDKEGKQIVVGKHYPCITSKTNKYIYSLKNISDQSISIKNIKIIPSLYEEANYNIVKSQEEINDLIYLDSNLFNDPFIIIRPEITYEYKEQDYYCYPDQVTLGGLNITDKVIKDIIKSN